MGSHLSKLVWDLHRFAGSDDHYVLDFPAALEVTECAVGKGRKGKGTGTIGIQIPTLNSMKDNG